MMIAYELHRPRPESGEPIRHEVILKAMDETDVMRLLALISIFHHGALDQALDRLIAGLAGEELEAAHEHKDQTGAG